MRVRVHEEEVRALGELIVVSGGLAWHFLSPAGHPEYRHAHDHKDLDFLVPPDRANEAAAAMKERGYSRVWTRFDRFPSAEQFRRYEKFEETKEGPVKVQVDFFVRQTTWRLAQGVRVVEPAELIGFYRSIHSSSSAWAVVQAQRLLADGIDPEGRPELLMPPESIEDQGWR